MSAILLDVGMYTTNQQVDISMTHFFNSSSELRTIFQGLSLVRGFSRQPYIIILHRTQNSREWIVLKHMYCVSAEYYIK